MAAETSVRCHGQRRDAVRLKKEYVAHDAGKESVLVPTGAAGWVGVVRGNRTLGLILSLLREDTTEEEVVSAMQERFAAPDGAIEGDVTRAIAELRRVGALDG